LPALAINKEKLVQERKAVAAIPEAVADPIIDDDEGPKFNLNLKVDPVKSLSFYITKVRCVDETNPEFGGDDEIHMGGLAIDKLGNVAKVGPFMVRDDFEDGVVKDYGSPGKEFVKFSAKSGKKWPKYFAVQVTLCEEDWGGFADALNKAETAVEPYA